MRWFPQNFSFAAFQVSTLPTVFPTYYPPAGAEREQQRANPTVLSKGNGLDHLSVLRKPIDGISKNTLDMSKWSVVAHLKVLVAALPVKLAAVLNARLLRAWFAIGAPFCGG